MVFRDKSLVAGTGSRGEMPFASVSSQSDALGRLSALAGIALLHLAVYVGATRAAAARAERISWDPTLALDLMIPHLAWTWPLYWIAYPFIAIGLGWALLQLSRRDYARAIAAMVVMVLLGGAFQALLPALSPWPQEPAPTQRWLHDSPLTLPYATVPSMRLAFVTFTACFIVTSTRRAWIAVASGLVVTLIAAGTLTLKEHLVLDVLTGALLGFMTFAWWLGGSIVKSADRPTT